MPYFGYGGELMEAPIMILVCYLIARYVVDLTSTSLTSAQVGCVGLLVLAYLLAVEFFVVLWFTSLRYFSICCFRTSSIDPEIVLNKPIVYFCNNVTPRN